MSRHPPLDDRTAALRPSDGVVSYVLDDDVLLFSEPQQRVFQLDATSGSVWLEVSAAEPPSSVARRIADERACTLEEANDYVSCCLAEWRRLGFLGSSAKGRARPTSGHNNEPASALATGDMYRVADTRIAISFPDISSREAWDAIAGHLRLDDAGVAEAQLDIEAFAGGYRMLGRSGDRMDFPDPASVAVGLKEAVLHTVLQRRPDSIALHAAVLASGSGSVLLAGASGHGKTTLAALLNASGMPLIADDVALVSVRPPRVAGLPFAFAAKPGSWDVLRAWFPALDGLAEYQRPDGRIVKYLEPVQILEQAGTVSAVFFPRFLPGARLRITRVGKPAALLSMLEEAINAGRWLSAEGFTALCELIDGAAMIGLQYADACRAAEWIKANLQQLDQSRARPGSGRPL